MEQHNEFDRNVPKPHQKPAPVQWFRVLILILLGGIFAAIAATIAHFGGDPLPTAYEDLFEIALYLFSISGGAAVCVVAGKAIFSLIPR